MAKQAYDVISTQTLASAVTSVTFSSIPQTYTDLVLWFDTSMSSTGASIYAEFNADTSTLYSVTYLGGNGTSAYTGRASSQNSAGIAAYSTGYGSSRFIVTSNIMNYSNTTTFKTVLNKYSQAGNAVEELVNLYRNTSAITSIKLNSRNGGTPTGHTFSVGSTFTLYGVKAAL
jgi:hypothetical protein